MYSEIEKWKSSGNYFTFQNHRIFYFQDGYGENLLIVHGFPFNSFEWKDTLSDLSKIYRVTIVDLLGVGFSDKPDNHNYNFEEYCEIINELLKALKISETHIISHHLGVNIVQELIAGENQNNFKIKSSAFLNGCLFNEFYSPYFIEDILSKSPVIFGKLLSRVISKKMTLDFFKSIFGPFTKPKEDFLEQQWQILNYKKGKSITYLFSRLLLDRQKYSERWTSALQSTNIPMCYICGPFNNNSGATMAYQFEKIVPKSRSYLLSKYVGQLPHLEDPENTLKIYHQFMNSIASNN
jgi:pimeloyl-ACP methyl ester carboxylesterase